MKRSIVLLALLATSAWAGDMNQPRTLGNRAVLHVYYYAPKTTRPSRCCGCAVTHVEEVNAELLSFFGEKASKATKAVA